MTKVFKKLRSSKGETLIETIVAVFIIAISSAVFATMVISSNELNKAALNFDKSFYTELSAAETHTGNIASTVLVSWTDGSASSQTFNITKTGSDGQFSSYVLAGG